MSNPNAGGEQNMEEILASIRRIISEDDEPAGEAPRSQPSSSRAAPGASSAQPNERQGDPRGSDGARANAGAAAERREPASEPAGRPPQGTIKPLSALLGGADLTSPPLSYEDPPSGGAAPATKPEAERSAPTQRPAARTAAQPQSPAVAPGASESPARANQFSSTEAPSIRRPGEPSPFEMFGKGGPTGGSASTHGGDAKEARSGGIAARVPLSSDRGRSDAPRTNSAGLSDARREAAETDRTALERLRATMPTLKRPQPHDDGESDSEPSPPGLREAVSDSEPVQPVPNSSTAEGPSGAASAASAAAKAKAAGVSAKAAPAAEAADAGTKLRNASSDAGSGAIGATPDKTSADRLVESGGSLTVVSDQRAAVAKDEKTDVAPATAALSPQPATLEETVAKMLRPMLKEWLDENMPRIVARMMEEETRDGLTGPKDDKRD